MAISPINGVPGIQPQSVVPVVNKTAPVKSDASFDNLIGNLVKDSNAQHTQADQSLEQLISGDADNLHNVVLDAARADLSFRLLMEIRNKLLDAYQEIMRMQV